MALHTERAESERTTSHPCSMSLSVVHWSERGDRRHARHLVIVTSSPTHSGRFVPRFSLPLLPSPRSPESLLAMSRLHSDFILSSSRLIVCLHLVSHRHLHSHTVSEHNPPPASELWLCLESRCQLVLLLLSPHLEDLVSVILTLLCAFPFPSLPFPLHLASSYTE